MSTISEINPVFCTPYTELANTDALTTLTKSCPEKIEFLLKIVVNASRTRSSGADRFYPDPFVYMQHIYSETLNETDFDEFIRVISSTRPFHEKLIESCNDIQFDGELIEKIRLMRSISNSEWFVRLLYFFIFSNTVSFSLLRSEQSVNVWKINNSVEKEQDFINVRGDEVFLYHGTSDISIYSIMRNGLKNMSSTRLMSSGAAYGPGVYLSDSVSFSMSYSRSSHGNDRYILIVRVRNPKLKSSCIYVQEDREVLIIGIISFPSSLDSTVIQNYIEGRASFLNSSYKIERIRDAIEVVESVQDKLTIKDIRRQPKNHPKALALPRFKGEMRRLFSISEDSHISRINFYGDDETNPLLIELKPLEDSLLLQDFREHGIRGLVVAIYLTEHYPFEPPQLRVVAPKLERRTGRVTIGGSICNEVLYKAGWSPALNIISLTQSVISVICSKVQNGTQDDAEGRLDVNSIGQEYSYAEYLEMHSNVASKYGWDR